jgi:hypothetical protein
VPVVAVLLAEVLPVVPTAPAVFELPMRQPTSVTFCTSLRAVVLLARVDRARRVARGVVACAPVVLVVSPPAVLDPGAVTAPCGFEPRCGSVLLCAPSAAVQPITSATTAESPARFILLLLTVRMWGSPERAKQAERQRAAISTAHQTRTRLAGAR